MTSIEVLNGGLFTTIQDFGRVGYRKYGIPVSGVMDIKSYELSNWLVGNPNGTPVLEFTLKGGRYLFHDNTVIAITGALMNPKINGSEIEMNCSLEIKEGDELDLGFAKRGCRAYLAIQGDPKISKVMDSYSTYITGKFGGFGGRTLKKGDILEWKYLSQETEQRKTPKEKIPYFSSKIIVRVIKGVEWDWFTQSFKDQFLDSKYIIGSSSNRMGIRMEGVSLNVPKREMTSSPVIPGIIQLPPNGNPIILMQDGQTIGGYPRIAKVVDEDLWRIGQLKPGDQLQFNLN